MLWPKGFTQNATSIAFDLNYKDRPLQDKRTREVLLIQGGSIIKALKDQERFHLRDCSVTLEWTQSIRRHFSF